MRGYLVNLKDLAARTLDWLQQFTQIFRKNSPIHVHRRLIQLKGLAPPRNSASPEGRAPQAPATLDEVSLALNELTIFMRRWFTSDLPHEVSVLIPRAEVHIRKGRGTEETDITLESITVVHSPRFPPKSSSHKDGERGSIS